MTDSNGSAAIALSNTVLLAQRSTKVRPVAPCNGKLRRCGVALAPARPRMGGWSL